MIFNKVDIVKGKYYEFNDIKGVVIQQINEGIVLVNFDSCPIPVATIVDNLDIIKRRILQWEW